MADRRERLAKQKRIRQFFRDLDDEKDWIREKLLLLEDSGKLGTSLLASQQIQRRHKMLGNEVEIHEPRIEAVCAVSTVAFSIYCPIYLLGLHLLHTFGYHLTILILE